MKKKPRKNQENLVNGKLYSSEYQPSSEAKKRGWKKKKEEEKEIETSAAIIIRVLQITSKNDNGIELTEKEKIIIALVEKAKNGDVKAIELILKLLGEMPADKQEINGTLSAVVPKIEVLPIKSDANTNT